MGVPRTSRGVMVTTRPGLEQHGLVIFQTPGTDFGALQVLKNADGAVFLFGRTPQTGDVSRVVGMGAMRKIQAGNVHAEAHHFAQHGLGIARGPDGTNNFGATNRGDGEFRRQIT